jgi:hypothetical protein
MSNLLDDFLDLEPFAAEVKRDPRTVRRWMNQPDGLPHVRIGNRLMVHVPTARKWIFSRMRRLPAPRRRKAAIAGVGALYRRLAEADPLAGNDDGLDIPESLRRAPEKAAAS